MKSQSVSAIACIVATAAYLLIHILQILDAVGNILFITDVILRNLLLATNALDNAIDQVGQAEVRIFSVLLQPFSRHAIGRVA